MQDSRWLRVITVGLFLASLAVAYFLLTGRLTSKSTPKTQPQVITSTPAASPNPSVLGQNSSSSTPVPSPQSAYERIAERSQSGVQTLPRTGFPLGLIIVFSVSAMVSGLGLRKFPS